VGLSPHAFQTQIRIEHAKRLIAQNEPMTYIGLHVGFFDQSHFIKVFKSLVGVTPSQYAARAQSSGRSPKKVMRESFSEF
jgi:AraC-like DNA-binding protein